MFESLKGIYFFFRNEGTFLKQKLVINRSLIMLGILTTCWNLS